MPRSESTEPFPLRVKRLAAERGLSISQLGNLAWDLDTEGTSAAQLQAVLRGTRKLQPVLVEAVAAVLEVDPTEFPEYRLALARDMLDENVVGLDQAVRFFEVSQLGERLTGAALESATKALQQAAKARGRSQPARLGSRGGSRGGS